MSLVQNSWHSPQVECHNRKIRKNSYTRIFRCTRKNTCKQAKNNKLTQGRHSVSLSKYGCGTALSGEPLSFNLSDSSEHNNYSNYGSNEKLCDHSPVKGVTTYDSSNEIESQIGDMGRNIDIHDKFSLVKATLQGSSIVNELIFLTTISLQI